MKFPISLTAFTLALFISGCGHQDHDTANSETHEHHDEPEDHAHDDHDHADHDHAETGPASPKVLLDNGKRWSANKETTEGIAKMRDLVTNFDPTSGDLKALKTGLEEEFALIFERCTMTGEAHNQLHNYLLPMHQELKRIDLSNASEVNELKAYLDTYSTYFE